MLSLSITSAVRSGSLKSTHHIPSAPGMHRGSHFDKESIHYRNPTRDWQRSVLPRSQPFPARSGSGTGGYGGGGRPETALINAGGVQMSKRYGLPSSPGSMGSMSKMIGPWTGHEHTLVPLTMALVHGMSYSTQFRMNETLIRKAHMPVQSEAGQSVNPSDGRLSIPKQTQRGEIPKENYWR